MILKKELIGEFVRLEDLSPPPSSTPVHFYQDNILEKEMLCVLGLMLYMFELRLMEWLVGVNIRHD